MKKSNKIIIKNNIQKEFYNSKNNKIINKKFSSILNDIFIDLNKSKNVFNSLSQKFRLNFNVQDLNKFKKFKSVIIIGMGGSILGAEAIYLFLKKKIKKNFFFLNNLDEDQLLKIKNDKNMDKMLFILISKSGNTIETLSNIKALKIIKKKK